MKITIKGKDYDHPEHYFDLIREFQDTDRYVPSHLGDLLLEQSGHKCTICKEPYTEIHHIEFLENGGKTEYENLIVLCPNCHTRVHREDVPSSKQLKHYKLKLEIAQDLPILSKLEKDEKKLLLQLSELSIEELVAYTVMKFQNIEVTDHDEANSIARKKIGLINPEAEGILVSNYGLTATDVDRISVDTRINLKLTSKGVKWISYLKNTDKLELLR